MVCIVKKAVLFLLLLATSGAASAQGVPSGLPSPPRAPVVSEPGLSAALDKIRRAKIFAAYREAIEIYKRVGRFDEAARLHREQAAAYRAKNLLDAAIISENSARALTSELRFFTPVTTSAQGAGGLYTGARLEPVTGCYLGAFIDLDATLGEPFRCSNFRSHRLPSQMLNAMRRHPGTLFTYVSYGQKPPLEWIEKLHEAGTLPIISWEPKNLSAVRDDAYLNDFARALGRTEGPVFVRFASEMNGSWTPWHGNPTLYREKFRLVERVMRRHAPRAAMMWIVNNPPSSNWSAYYPGDDAVDWVGVNFYSVPYFDNNRARPAFEADPRALLDAIYRQFSARKPIAIGEFAASHRSGLDNTPIPDFAVQKMRLIYESLPLFYPRVKMINWFSTDTIALRLPGKSLNDFRLSASPTLLKAWQDATAPSWFLQREARASEPWPPVYRPCSPAHLNSQREIRVWSRSFDVDARVFVALDGKIVHQARGSGASSFSFDPNALRKGAHSLVAYLYDGKNRFQRETKIVWTKP